VESGNPNFESESEKCPLFALKNADTPVFYNACIELPIYHARQFGALGFFIPKK